MTKTEMKQIARRLVLDYGNTADAYEETIREFRDECRDLDDDEWHSMMRLYWNELERVAGFLGLVEPYWFGLCLKCHKPSPKVDNPNDVVTHFEYWEAPPCNCDPDDFLRSGQYRIISVDKNNKVTVEQ